MTRRFWLAASVSLFAVTSSLFAVTAAWGQAVSPPPSSLLTQPNHWKAPQFFDAGMSGVYNNLTVTPPATGATLTIKDGKTLTWNKSITIDGADGTTMTMPGASDTLAGLGGTNVWAQPQTFPGGAAGSTWNKVTITPPATGSTLTILDGKTFTARKSLTLDGTDGTTMTMPAATDTLAGLAVNNQRFTGSMVVGAAAGAGILSLDGAAGQQRQFRVNTAGVQRWTLMGMSNAESGNNLGTDLWIRAFNDAGVSTGQVLQASRGSGPFGAGPPYLNFLSTYQQTIPRQTTPGSVAGNLQDFSGGIDLQPAVTLLANPISTTQGSRTVVFNWQNCCTTTGPLYSATREVWASINGAGIVAGIDFRPVDNPNGWYKITKVDNNNFSILVNTTSGPANATTTGGGTTTTVQPSAGVQGNKTVINMTSGGNGFPDGFLYYFVANPLFYSTTGSGPRYQANFTQVYSPNDRTDNNIWATVGHEWNYINRGNDYGYQPIASSAKHNMVGEWMGPLVDPVTVVPGGGTGQNWPIVKAIFGGGGLIGVYNGYSIQPDALVGAANDPTGHGGVGYEVYGAYETLASNPFTITNGSNLVTVFTQGSAADNMPDGTSVYFPTVFSQNGVTFGGQSYVTQNTDHAGNSFKIIGSGTATGGASFGGSGNWYAFTPTVPYAPYQAAGEFRHGWSVNPNAKFDDGLALNSIPGAGIGWSEDPTTANVANATTASVTGNKISPGNIDVILTAAGTGLVKAASPLRLKGFTVATLPACAASGEGAMAYVTDATAPAYNAALTGGGAVRIPVFCNGSAWTAH
jgi:hypothetical protein